MVRLHPSRLLTIYVALLLMVEATVLVRARRVPEGAVLVAFNPEHGITSTDAAGVVLVFMALVLIRSVVMERGSA